MARAMRGVAEHPTSASRRATIAWARGHGWDAALAARLADLDEATVAVAAAWPRARALSSAAALAAHCDGRMMVPLRFEDGQIWGVATRGPGDAAWRVETTSETGPAIVGSVPEVVAQARDGAPVRLACDPAIYLALRAAGLAAVAVLAPERCGALIRALDEALGDAGLHAPCVVVGAEPNVARALAEQLTRRVPRAAPITCVVLGHWTRDGVRLALDTPSTVRSAALPLDDAQAAVRRCIAGLADRGRAGAARLDTLDVLIAPTGVGKSFAIDAAAHAGQRAGDRVGVLTPTLEGAREHAARIDAAGGSTRMVEGALRQCSIYEAAEPDAQTRIRRRYAAGGRAGLCAGCRLRKTCPGAVAPRLEPTYVAVGAHQAAQSLCRPPPKSEQREPDPPGLLILDECPPTVTDDEPTSAELMRGLMGCAAGRAWRDGMSPEQRATLAGLPDALDAAARHVAAHARPGRPIRWLLVPGPVEGERPPLAAWLAQAGIGSWTALPGCAPPTPEQALDRGAPDHPDQHAAELARAIVDAVIAAQSGGRPSSDAAGITLRVEAVGGGLCWILERGAPLALPEPARIIIADATAGHRLAEYEAIARHNQRTLRVHRIDVDPGFATDAIHVSGQSFRGPQLREPADAHGERALRDRAPGAVRRAIVEGLLPSLARLALGRDRPLRMAVLSYKQVAAALRGEDPSDVGRQLAALADALAALGLALDVGHFGAHDKGLNRWETAEVLLILGDGSDEWGEVERHAHTLGLDPEPVHAGRTTAMRVQRIGRARLLRRADHPPLVILAAARAPPVIGLRWVERPVHDGPAPPMEHLVLGVHLMGMVRDLGYADVAGVAQRSGYSYRFTRSAFTRLAETLGMRRCPLRPEGCRGRPPLRYCLPGHLH